MISKETLEEIRTRHKNNGGHYSVSVMQGAKRKFLVTTNCIHTAKTVFKHVPKSSVGVVFFGS